ncbi:MAG: hypothetical protein EA401_00230 [Planctomycetota bacterium]|nr:MAG: hypothetical protein EA401_00230 [Planctomycetota bacterium]
MISIIIFRHDSILKDKPHIQSAESGVDRGHAVHHRRLTATLDSVPRQLGQKFTFTKVDREERAAALRQALDLLCSARVYEHPVVDTDT